MDDINFSRKKLSPTKEDLKKTQEKILAVLAQ